MRAELADGRILEFPDGTDPSVIQATVKKVLGQPQAAPQAAPVPQQAAPQQASQDQGFFGNVAEDLAARNRAIQETQLAAQRGEIGSTQGAIQAFGQVAGGGLDIVGEGISAVGSGIAAITPEAIKKPIAETFDEAVDFIADSNIGSAAIRAIKGGVETYQGWKGENPQAAKTLESGVNIAMLLAPVKGGAKAAPEKAALTAKETRAAADAADISRVKETLGLRKETMSAIDETKPKINTTGSIKADINPEAQDYDKVLDNLKRQKAQKAAIDAMPDKDIMAAADDLGVDLNPDHYSNNRVFRELTQRLKDRPGSKLGAIEEKAIMDLGTKADDLIKKIGGQTDKTLLDLNIKNDIDGTIGLLEKQANSAYAAVDAAIPKMVKVKPEASRAYIKNVLEELAGDKSHLSKAEKSLLAVMKKNPTYASLDRIRKDVGDGFRKKSGPYKDDNSGTLKQVYRVLSEDQQGVSDSFGVGADYAAARRLVVSRKDVEDEAIKLFGRDANGSIIPKITQAATSLTKGDTSKFDKLMKAIPQNRRQEAAATMLNDLFTQGARAGQPLGQGFVKAYEGLNRNAGAKNILFSELPKDARIRFDKIGRVATGIFRSKALENTSKTAGSLIAAMDDGGMFSKVYDVGRKVAVAEGVGQAVGVPFVGAGSVLGAQLVKGRTTATQAADTFVTSKKFKEAIEIAAKTGDAKKADAILKTSQEFNKWRKFLPKDQKTKLAAVGFISWITDQEEEK